MFPRVADVVRDVIAELAPDELPLVDGLRQFDDEQAVSRLTRRRTRGEPLGFGFDEIAVVLLTPVVWVAVDEVVRRAIGATANGLGRRMGRWFRKLARKRPAGYAVPRLMPEQIAEVHRRVLELASSSGVPPQQAAILADRVAARLMLEPGPNPPDSGN